MKLHRSQLSNYMGDEQDYTAQVNMQKIRRTKPKKSEEGLFFINQKSKIKSKRQ